MNNEVTDGYGVSFPPHSQEFHARAIRDALEQHEKDQMEPKPVPEQVPWKDAPAGRYERGSGV